MDLALYLRVLWRFKFIVIAGLLASVALVFVWMASVSYHDGSLKIRYRQPETWQATSTLLITQAGFPDGRSVVPIQVPPASASGKTVSVVPKWADPSRFTYLALLYARLAVGDDIHKIMLRSGPIRGTVSAAPVFPSGSNTSTLPMLAITGSAATSSLARGIATRATGSFLTYLQDQQAAAGIPTDQRVLVTEVNQPLKPLLVAGRKKTMPILIVVAMMSLAIGLAFILENARPRVREAALPTALQEMHSEARRSA